MLLICVVTCGDFGGSLRFVWIAFVIAFGVCVGLSGCCFCWCGSLVVCKCWSCRVC